MLITLRLLGFLNIVVIYTVAQAIAYYYDLLVIFQTSLKGF